jgi:ABC-2 type transport system ATP-binding protein
MEIDIQGVSHTYGKVAALDDISLTLKPGFNILLGPNGAGKSSLFGLLTGLQRIGHGNILFNGKPITKNRASIMKNLGVVFQQSTLDIDLTVKQNLAYFASLHGLAPDKSISRITDLLTKLDLSDRLNTKIRHLNGGHRRRVELARCLIHQPSTLLLDEPTVGLDIASRQLIHSVVHDLAVKQGVTVLWATHLFEEVSPADPLAILLSGRLVERDICSALLTKHQVSDIHQLWDALTHAN